MKFVIYNAIFKNSILQLEKFYILYSYGKGILAYTKKTKIGDIKNEKIKTKYTLKHL